jgi:RNA polymerase sigma factor (sigma-70 family)
MYPTDDSALLRQYAENHSDEAFAALVTRHINLVYSVALRHVGAPHQAEEVTQAVFILLAKKALQLRHDKALSSWLFQATRLTASNFVRSETRRHHREQEAHMQSLLDESGSDVWRQIAPLLDSAVADLNETDRQAIVLRFYEGKNLREVGAVLGASEDAAEKRVSRAVDKLRMFFAKRGVTVGASGLVVVISANAVQAAPVGLAVTISTAAALAGTSIAATATATAVKTIAMTTLQKTLIAAIVVASVGSPLVVQHQAQARLREQDEAMRQRANQLAELQAENERLSNKLALSKNPQSLPDDQSRELLRLRGEVGLLRRGVQELSQPKTTTPLSREDMLASKSKLYADRVAQLKQLFDANPAERIPELQYLTGDSWIGLVTEKIPSNEDDNRRAMSGARGAAEYAFACKMLRPALQQYAKANNGQFPSDLFQLKPYFKVSVDEAILQRWVVLPKGSLVKAVPRDSIEQLGENWYITEKSPVNAKLDGRILCGQKEVHSQSPGRWDIVH